jgi:hypothetical protein
MAGQLPGPDGQDKKPRFATSDLPSFQHAKLNAPNSIASFPSVLYDSNFRQNVNFFFIFFAG